MLIRGALPLSIVCLLCASVHAAEGEGSGTKKKPSILWGYKGGFFAKTDDDRFKLKIAGWAQMTFTTQFTDGDYSKWIATDDGCKKKEDLRDSELTKNELKLRRARMVIKATTFRYFHTKVVLEYKRDFSALYYFLTFQPIPQLGVRVGQFKTPLSRHYLLIPWRRTFVSGALAMTQFNLGADYGATVLGSFRNKLIEYQAGIFNGSGIDAPQDNNKFLMIARVSVNPLGPVPMIESDLEGTPRPLLSLGVSGAYNPKLAEKTDYKVCSTTTRSEDEITIGADATFIYRGLVATSELYFRSLKRDGAERVDALGFFAHVGYFVWPRKIELAARTSMVRADLDATDKDKWEVSLIGNWFVHKTQLELQAEYSYRLTKKPTSEDAQGHWVKLQLLWRF